MIDKDKLFILFILRIAFLYIGATLLMIYEKSCNSLIILIPGCIFSCIGIALYIISFLVISMKGFKKNDDMNKINDKNLKTEDKEELHKD